MTVNVDVFRDDWFSDLLQSAKGWVSSFLMAHQHILGYSVPYNGVNTMIKV